MKIYKRLLVITIILSLTSVGWLTNSSFSEDNRRKFVDKETITIIPLGSIDRGLLTMLTNSLEEVFSQSVSITSPMQLPSGVYNPERQQYHATEILDTVRKKKLSNKGRRLGIVDVDLYVPELNFVFGQADLSGRAALISLSRLRQEFYGLPGDEDLFLQRSLKEAIHELGHTFGLRHCKNETCVMHFSNSLVDTDRKQAAFCSLCRKKIP